VALTVVGLGGGIGASRLWRALVRTAGPSQVTLVVNTADDLWIHGLRVCPDLDTTLYALAGLQDEARGWGRREESFRCMAALQELGRDAWFQLGDTDLATHLLRTGLLRAGVGLTEITRRLAAAWSVPVRVLPMTEQEVATRVRAEGGQDLHYQEFLVRDRASVPVHRVWYDGLDRAAAGPGVLAAISGADLVVLGPSNPVASMLPILGLPGIRAALRAARERVVAVAPIVSGVPVRDPHEMVRAASRAALLAAAGVPATATGVAGLYADLCARYVLDVADAEESAGIRELGMEPVVACTLVHRGASASALSSAVLGRESRCPQTGAPERAPGRDKAHRGR
jgi:LPPG:FO 2-phospho-L-lactate transferase